MSWSKDLESKLYTQIEYELSEKYPDLNCVVENRSGTPTEFPTLYIHELQSPSLHDLTHLDKIGVNHYIEIQCFAEARDECKSLADEAEDFMVSLGYNTTGILITSNEDYTMSVARYNRIVGGSF